MYWLRVHFEWESNNILNIYLILLIFKFLLFFKFSFLSYIKGKQIHLFQPSFDVLHSYYEWNNNTILPLINKCMSFEMGWIFFQSNLIQFAVWYWGTSLLCLMNFWKRLSFLSYSFKRDVTWQTSFLFTTIIILLNNHYFQQWLYCRLPSFKNFHLPTIWAVEHFHLWSHHRHL